MKRLVLAFSVVALGLASASPAAAGGPPSFRCSADESGTYLGVHQPGSDGWASFLAQCRDFGQQGNVPGRPVPAN